MPPRSRREFQDSSAHAAADVLCEFLEAAVHATLHRRGVYPEELFERVSLYGINVQRSRHPELNAYIGDVVGGAHGWVCRGAARCLELVVTSAQHAVLERHVFQFQLLGAAATAAEQLAAGTLPLPAGADADSEPAAALERRLAELLVVQAQRDAWRAALPAGTHALLLSFAPTPLTPHAPRRLHLQTGGAHH